MLIASLIVFQFLFISSEAYVNNDAVTEKSKKNFTQIWHSYEFDTGVGNREELYVVKTGLYKNFVSAEGIFMWKSLQTQGETILIGLGKNFILVTSYNNKNDTSVHKEEIQGFTKVLNVFQKWDAKSQSVQNFVLLTVSTKEKNYLFKWYMIINRQLKFICDWPFYQIITHVDVIKVNYKLKLLIVSHQEGKGRNSSIDIYNFNLIPQLDLWLFEKISLDDIPSSVTVFSDNDNAFLTASFPQSGIIQVWRYSRTLCLQCTNQKHFNFHQKISVNGLRSLISFRVGFLWHIAVASKNSTIYQMRENLLLYPVSSFNLGSQNHWLAMPIDNYREDVMLFSSSDSRILGLIWNGNENLQIIKNFTQLICNRDVDCKRNLKNISLKNAITFQFNGHQNIVISSETGITFVIKLLVKLRALPDKVSIQFNEIRKLKNKLDDNYTIQTKDLKNLIAFNEKFLTKNIYTNSTKFPPGNATTEENPITFNINKNKGNFESMSLVKNWTDFLISLDVFKSRLSEMKKFVQKLNANLNLNTSSIYNENHENAFLPHNISTGITFDGKIVINNLNLSVFNGHDIEDLLKNSYRKDIKQKISGTKIFEKVNTKNLVFEKVNDILARDILFSNDAWEALKENVVNGDILWESKVNILQDLLVKHGATKSHSSIKNYESFSNISNYIFEELNFEKLKITMESYVGKSVNSLPLILPVHTAPLDVRYLDTINQARIEFINVKNNLSVSLLNGKNFSTIAKQLIYSRNTTQQKYDFAKIQGVLKVRALQAENFNSVNLKSNQTLFEYKVLPKSRKNSYKSAQNIKTAENLSPKVNEKNVESTEKLTPKINEQDVRNLKNLFSETNASKRKIYVFHNLEINGTLYSNEVNNLGWKTLNNTLRKGACTSVKGSKKFKKSVASPKIDITGSLNDTVPDAIMTYFSDQVVPFPQKFRAVNFQNVSLKGLWNDVNVEKLNRFLVQIEQKGCCQGTLIIPKGFTLFIEHLNVTGWVNNDSIKEWNNYQGRNISLTRSPKFKLIKASKAIVNGSLNTNYNINGKNLTMLENLRVTLKGTQNIERNFSVTNINLQGNLKAFNLNGNEILQIGNSNGDNNVTDHLLSGRITRVKKLLVKGFIDTTHGINGYNLSRLLENGIRISEPNSVNGDIAFENIVYLNSLNVTNSMDGINLKNLAADIAMKQSHVFISGVKKFSTLRVLRDVKTKYLNNHLIQEIVTLKGDQAMKDSVKIIGNVIIRGNVTTNGNINNISILHLLKKYSTHYNSYIFMKDLKLNSIAISVQNMLVSGTIQNVSFGDLVKNAVAKEESCNITGNTLFKGEVEFRENVFIEETINSWNFNEVFNNIIYVNQPAKIKGKLSIKEAVFNVLKVKDYFNASLINNFATNDLFDESVPLDHWVGVNGNFKFENPLAFGSVKSGFINNHISTSVIPLKGSQFIPVLGLFQRLNLTSDLPVEGLVNEHNLKKEFEKSILVTGNETINSNIIFNKDFVVKGNLFVDYVQGKAMKNLITLDTKQIISSHLNFSGSVTVKGNVDYLKIINGINLIDWYARSIFLNREQEIYGMWKMKGVVKAKYINGDASLGAFGLADVAKEIVKAKMIITEKKEETKMEYFSQCHKLDEFSQKLNKLLYYFHHFDVAQILETQSVIESVIPLKIGSSHYLIITFWNECFSALYQWHKENTTYSLIRHINIGPVTKWSVSYHNNATYLITSLLYNGSKCEENLQPGNIWIFNENYEKYIHLFTGNAFTDIIQENETSKVYYTLEAEGSLLQWFIKNDENVEQTIIANVGPGYMFIDFKILGRLAVSNSKEIKTFEFRDGEAVLSSIFILHGKIVALPINEKILVALIHKDKIVILENLRGEKVINTLHTHKVGSILWFNYGLNKQAFLIVSSHHKLIEIFEYKSAAGFIKRMSIQLLSNRLQSVSLPSVEKHQLVKFVAVIQKNKVIFLEASILGDSYLENNSFC